MDSDRSLAIVVHKRHTVVLPQLVLEHPAAGLLALDRHTRPFHQSTVRDSDYTDKRRISVAHDSKWRFEIEDPVPSSLVSKDLEHREPAVLGAIGRRVPASRPWFVLNRGDQDDHKCISVLPR